MDGFSRYLLVKSALPSDTYLESAPAQKKAARIPTVDLDPVHPLTLAASGTALRVQIPVVTYKMEKLLRERHSEAHEEENDPEDEAIFIDNHAAPGSQAEPIAVDEVEVIEIEDDEEDWEHDENWVRQATDHLAPAPEFANSSATMSVQRELKAMLKEQGQAKKLKDLGWHMPKEFIGDNLFQWIVELHSFDPELPLAIDMVEK